MSEPVGLDAATLKGDEQIDTPYGPVVLEHSFPTDASSQVLFDAMDAQRAAQAYMWSVPLVGFACLREQQRAVYGATEARDFVLYDTLREKRGIITANLTTPYILGFADLADGPILIDYPAGATAGGVLDFWQRPVTDLGLTGPDQGAGGQYVIVGPHDDPTDYARAGVYVAQSETLNVLVGLRILSTDPDAVAAAKASFAIGALDKPAQPARFIEGIDQEWDSTPPRGLEYWNVLARILHRENIRDIDKPMTAMLVPLGIAKGQPFDPDDRQRRILTDGAALGELFARNMQVNPRYTEPYWVGTAWYKSFDFGTSQETETQLQLDERTTWFYEAITSSKGMVEPTPGSGQIYMTSKRDSSGALLRADRTYRLRVPSDVPAAQFWSLTLYSEETRRPYDNGSDEVRSVSLDSRDSALQFNQDGSVDLYIGTRPPTGFESNWMATAGTDGWFVIFRLYAPTEPFFEKTWSLPDFELQS